MFEHLVSIEAIHMPRKEKTKILKHFK